MIKHTELFKFPGIGVIPLLVLMAITLLCVSVFCVLGYNYLCVWEYNWPIVILVAYTSSAIVIGIVSNLDLRPCTVEKLYCPNCVPIRSIEIVLARLPFKPYDRYVPYGSPKSECSVCDSRFYIGHETTITKIGLLENLMEKLIAIVALFICGLSTFVLLSNNVENTNIVGLSSSTFDYVFLFFKIAGGFLFVFTLACFDWVVGCFMRRKSTEIEILAIPELVDALELIEMNSSKMRYDSQLVSLYNNISNVLHKHNDVTGRYLYESISERGRKEIGHYEPVYGAQGDSVMNGQPCGQVWVTDGFEDCVTSFYAKRKRLNGVVGRE